MQKSAAMSMSEEAFSKFLNFCNDNLTGSNKQLISLIKKRYNDCTENYKNSRELRHLLSSTRKRMASDTKHLFVHLKDCLNELKANSHGKGEKRKRTAQYDSDDNVYKRSKCSNGKSTDSEETSCSSKSRSLTASPVVIDVAPGINITKPERKQSDKEFGNKLKISRNVAAQKLHTPNLATIIKNLKEKKIGSLSSSTVTSEDKIITHVKQEDNMTKTDSDPDKQEASSGGNVQETHSGTDEKKKSSGTDQKTISLGDKEENDIPPEGDKREVFSEEVKLDNISSGDTDLVNSHCNPSLDSSLEIIDTSQLEDPGFNKTASCSSGSNSKDVKARQESVTVIEDDECIVLDDSEDIYDEKQLQMTSTSKAAVSNRLSLSKVGSPKSTQATLKSDSDVRDRCEASNTNIDEKEDSNVDKKENAGSEEKDANIDKEDECMTEDACMDVDADIDKTEDAASDKEDAKMKDADLDKENAEIVDDGDAGIDMTEDADSNKGNENIDKVDTGIDKKDVDIDNKEDANIDKMKDSESKDVGIVKEEDRDIDENADGSIKKDDTDTDQKGTADILNSSIPAQLPQIATAIDSSPLADVKNDGTDITNSNMCSDDTEEKTPIEDMCSSIKSPETLQSSSASASASASATQRDTVADADEDFKETKCNKSTSAKIKNSEEAIIIDSESQILPAVDKPSPKADSHCVEKINDDTLLYSASSSDVEMSEPLIESDSAVMSDSKASTTADVKEKQSPAPAYLSALSLEPAPSSSSYFLDDFAGTSKLPKSPRSPRSKSPRSPRSPKSPVSAVEREEKKEKKKKEVSAKHIHRLEKLLEKLRDKIDRIQERELTLADLDDEDSNYIYEDKLKKKFVAVWNKLCELKERPATTGRPIERKFTYQGTRYPEVNKKIEKMINKKKIFPDFHDIKRLVAKVNIRHKLHLSNPVVDSLAREAFTDVGNSLQHRRREDFITTFGCKITDSVDVGQDPAVFDHELRQKLDSNKTQGKARLEEVIKKYSDMQHARGDVPEEVPECSDEEEKTDAEKSEEEMEVVAVTIEDLASDSEDVLVCEPSPEKSRQVSRSVTPSPPPTVSRIVLSPSESSPGTPGSRDFAKVIQPRSPTKVSCISPLTARKSELPLSASPLTVLESPNPVSVSVEPAPVSPVPLSDSPEPVIVSPVPVSVSPQPLSVSPIPLLVSPKPVSTPPAPLSDSPKPISPSPKQVSITPEPTSVSPKPISISPRPVSVSPEAVLVSPEPESPQMIQPRYTTRTSSPSPIEIDDSLVVSDSEDDDDDDIIIRSDDCSFTFAQSPETSYSPAASPVKNPTQVSATSGNYQSGQTLLQAKGSSSSKVGKLGPNYNTLENDKINMWNRTCVWTCPSSSANGVKRLSLQKNSSSISSHHKPFPGTSTPVKKISPVKPFSVNKQLLGSTRKISNQVGLHNRESNQNRNYSTLPLKRSPNGQTIGYISYPETNSRMSGQLIQPQVRRAQQGVWTSNGAGQQTQRQIGLSRLQSGGSRTHLGVSRAQSGVPRQVNSGRFPQTQRTYSVMSRQSQQTSSMVSPQKHRRGPQQTTRQYGMVSPQIQRTNSIVSHQATRGRNILPNQTQHAYNMMSPQSRQMVSQPHARKMIMPVHTAMMSKSQSHSKVSRQVPQKQMSPLKQAMEMSSQCYIDIDDSAEEGGLYEENWEKDEGEVVEENWTVQEAEGFQEGLDQSEGWDEGKEDGMYDVEDVVVLSDSD